MNLAGDWTNAFLLEMKVANIISLQAKYGTQFDERACKWTIHLLNESISNIDREMIPLLPPMMNKGTEYKKPFKLNGQFMKYPGEYAERVGLSRSEVGGPFTAIWYTPFDVSKQARVKQVLLDYGWLPTEWNIKKMPFQLWTYRKRLEKISYANFINNQCDKEDKELFTTLVDGFVQKHFKNQSVGYMKAVLHALGFDLDKRTPTFDQIKKKLLLCQYWPTSPKITEDSFDSMDASNSRVAGLLKQRMMMSHRRSLLEGLLAVQRPDGKISGEANPCATPTARMTHKKIVNIPAAGAFLGKECRKLFTGDYNGTSQHAIVRGKDYTPEKILAGKVRKKPGTNICQILDEKKGKWEDEGYCYHYVREGYDFFVGGDGAGLELRMLTHYLIAVSKMMLERAQESGDTSKIALYQAALDSAYTYRDILLTGDIHSHNQKLAGLPTRKQAKGFIYAFLYGAGNAKLGSLVGGGTEEGAILREAFLRECPCIPVLIEWVQGFAKENGWVPAIDGRRLIMRRDPITGEVMAHKALNLMLQAAGSIVMKYSMCFLDGWIKQDEIKCHQVIMMHDEFQYTCVAAFVGQLRRRIDSCVMRAGLFLKMECPLASDSLAGGTWYATH